MTIPAVQTTYPDGSVVYNPEEPFPSNAVLILCDGTTYTIYQSGDTLPSES
jgi:hypothetical protein